MNTRKQLGSNVLPSVNRRSSNMNQVFDINGKYLGTVVNGKLVQPPKYKRNPRGLVVRSKPKKTERKTQPEIYYRLGRPYVSSGVKAPIHNEDIQQESAKIVISPVVEALEQVINQENTKFKNSCLDIKEIGGAPGTRSLTIGFVKDNGSRTYLAEVMYSKSANPFPIIFDDADEIRESLDDIEELKLVVGNWLEELIDDQISDEYLVASDGR